MKNNSKKTHAPGQESEIQRFGTVINRAISLDHKVRMAGVETLNRLLADTMTLRDMYKKHHWQVSGPTFYQLHLLFDKHYSEQAEIVDALAERVQTLGGVAIAMAPDVRRNHADYAPSQGPRGCGHADVPSVAGA